VKLSMGLWPIVRMTSVQVRKPADRKSIRLILALAVRIQWAKAQARALRYAEEHELLQEEMQRVCLYLGWKGSWWRDQRFRGRMGASRRVKAGLDAYAKKQASILESLRAHFINLWRPLLNELGLATSWMNGLQKGRDFPILNYVHADKSKDG